MGFSVFCGTLIALFLGLIICFSGYRLFLMLLPIWGFFFGFALGAETLQLLFGAGFLATITGWVVGFIVGAIFAVLSYLFYAFAVAVIAGSLGYALGAGLMQLINIDWGWLVWLVGIVVAVIAIIVTFRFNLQKYVIIVTTSLGGAGIVVGTLTFGIVGMSVAQFFENPIQAVIGESWLWALFFLVLAGLGIAAQLYANRAYEIEAYENRI
jgi:hypothetical protein